MESTRNLLAHETVLNQSETLLIEDLRASARALLDQLESNLNFAQGAVTMFALDVPPDVPPQYAPIVIAQAPQIHSADSKVDRTIGVCHLVENKAESRLSAKNSTGPIGETWAYFKRQENLVIDDAAFKAASATLLQPPLHGELRLYESTKSARYFPASSDYLGPDSATVLVEIGGYKVKVMYFFKLMKSVAPGE